MNTVFVLCLAAAVLAVAFTLLMVGIDLFFQIRTKLAEGDYWSKKRSPQ